MKYISDFARPKGAKDKKKRKRRKSKRPQYILESAIGSMPMSLAITSGFKGWDVIKDKAIESNTPLGKALRRMLRGPQKLGLTAGVSPSREQLMNFLTAGGNYKKALVQNALIAAGLGAGKAALATRPRTELQDVESAISNLENQPRNLRPSETRLLNRLKKKQRKIERQFDDD